MDDHSRPSRFRTPPEAIVVPDDAVGFFFFFALISTVLGPSSLFKHHDLKPKTETTN
jgi:hypothetical protein